MEFEPQDKQIFSRMPNGKFERKIFSEPFPLLESDWEHYEQFNQYLEQNGLEMPKLFEGDT